jgi:copper(I)-binding protein
MQMRPLAGVDLPAGQKVTLKPGGMHIMLVGLRQPLKQGDSFPLTLSFEKAGRKEVTVAIQGPGAMGPQAGSSGSAPMGNMPMGNMPTGNMPMKQ